MIVILSSIFLQPTKILVTKCNTSQIYADFRQPTRKTQNGLWKKILDFFLFLTVLRFVLDFPVVRADIQGSGDGLSRTCRQIIFDTQKTFFSAVEAAKNSEAEIATPTTIPTKNVTEVTDSSEERTTNAQTFGPTALISTAFDGTRSEQNSDSTQADFEIPISFEKENFTEATFSVQSPDKSASNISVNISDSEIDFADELISEEGSGSEVMLARVPLCRTLQIEGN